MGKACSKHITGVAHQRFGKKTCSKETTCKDLVVDGRIVLKRIIRR
jgi:hypothetical protein